MTDDERIAYLAGDSSGAALDPADLAELDDLRELLADPALWVEPDAGLAQRVLDGIAAERPADTAAERPADTAPERLADVVPISEHRTRRLRYALLGAAAALIVAVGVAVGITSHQAHGAQFAASLTGTSLAPGATGSATLTQTTGGWHIQLNATGLPRLDNGSYYEAWLKDPNGVLVPVGTFNQPEHVTLWAGVPPTSYPTLTITRQTVAGGPASSHQVVLAGPVKPS